MSVVVFLAAITGCASDGAVSTTAVGYSAAHDARMRVYGNNGFGVVYWPGKACRPRGGAGGVRASGAMGQSLGAFLGATKDTRIGMPESNRSRHRDNGILAREFFTEYVVAGGEPVAFEMSFADAPAYAPPNGGYGAGTMSCRAFSGSFLPQAGQDYEVYMRVAGRGCQMNVGHIDERGELVPEPITPAPICEAE